MNGDEVCVCGHAADEHGKDPKFPGSTACTVTVSTRAVGTGKKQRPVKCDCIAFDAGSAE